MPTLDEQIEWIEARIANGPIGCHRMFPAILATLRQFKAWQQAEPVAVKRHDPDVHMVGPSDGGSRWIEELTHIPDGTLLYATPQPAPDGWVKEAIAALKTRMDEHDSFNENTGLETAVQELETLSAAPAAPESKK